MNRDELQALLAEVRDGTLEPGAARERLERLTVRDLGFARLDMARELRTGVAEAVFAEGKTPEQLLEIVGAIVEEAGRVLVTRLEHQISEVLLREFPAADYCSISRSLTIGRCSPARGSIGVVSAGTSDLPVAGEAARSAAWMGHRVDSVRDVGVAGIQRLLDQLSELRDLDVLIVAAGMDGALPAVVAGLVTAPVIGLPTSVGYGVALAGVGPLVTMLNSCSPGVAVVNIDNGFGAAAVAHRILAAAPRRG